MWAYVATYQMPNDDPAALERRVRIDYPVRVDRVHRPRQLPTLRLQRAFGAPGRSRRASSAAAVWSHWMWFLVPHGTVAYLLSAPPRPLPARRRAACTRRSTSALIGYWARADRAALVRGRARRHGRRAARPSCGA